jgi:hypothetical protein
LDTWKKKKIIVNSEVTLKEALQNLKTNDKIYLRDLPPLSHQSKIMKNHFPNWLVSDELNILSGYISPEELWYQYAGNSGLKVHIDPTATTSFNIGISGSKNWIIFPQLHSNHLPFDFEQFIENDLYYDDLFQYLIDYKGPTIKLYVFEQNMGDIVVVPPLVPHTTNSPQFVHSIVKTFLFPWNLELIDYQRKLFCLKKKDQYFQVKRAAFNIIKKQQTIQ